MFWFSLAVENVTPEPSIDFGMLIFRMLIFLALIIALIYVVLRKGLPLLMQAQGLRTRTIKILERVPVDQKRSLLVVEIQEKVYLLGSAEGQINVLMELDRDKLPLQPATGAKATTKFEDFLKKSVTAKGEP